MGKNKTEQYLPLHWVQEMRSQAGDIADVPPKFLRIICEANSTEEECSLVAQHIPLLGNMLNTFNTLNSEAQESVSADFNSMSLIMLWSMNKQVFKFDESFLNELINTNSITMTENLWDYLPFDTFYVDISDAKDICERIMGKGIFVRVEKAPLKKIKNRLLIAEELHSPTAYAVHVTKVTEELFFSNIFAYDNCTSERTIDELPARNEISIISGDGGILTKTGKATIDERLYRLLVSQILTYLASVEPDVEENENTKRTYRKPKPDTAPKNKFSEIQQWDVGVRFGASYRKWKKSQEEPSSNEPKSSGERSKQRPHSRRAHWSHYWYGTGENKERRPKWVASYLVNVDDDNQDVAVIHKVSE